MILKLNRLKKMVGKETGVNIFFRRDLKWPFILEVCPVNNGTVNLCLSNDELDTLTYIVQETPVY